MGEKSMEQIKKNRYARTLHHLSRVRTKVHKHRIYNAEFGAVA